MAYEKKIEPLTRWETVLCGLTLLLWIIFLQVLPIGAAAGSCRSSLLGVDLSDQEGVADFHNCLKDHRADFLAGATFLLLGYPIIITHLYTYSRIWETMGAFLHLGFIHFLYIASWTIICIIYCTFVPALIIFIVYYDWEFEEGFQHMGYAMQFQFSHFLQIVYDTLIIPMGVNATLPMITYICMILGLFKSSHYELSLEKRREIVAKFVRCPRAGKCCLVIMFLTLAFVFFFASVADVFDYEKEGFFSYDGESQWLFVLLHLSWLFNGICTMWLGCTLKTFEDFLNTNVRPLSAQGGQVSFS